MSEEKKIEVEDEIADIAIYLLSFCNQYDISLEKAMLRKIKKNNLKYPVKINKRRINPAV